MCYAAKANTFLLNLLENEVEYFEICSPGEYQICKELHIDTHKIVLSGVYKKKEDIEAIFHSRQDLPIMTIESLQHFEIIDELSKKYQRKVVVLLRLTSGNQFGLDKELLKEILLKCQQSQLLLPKGIQYFSGTQKHSEKRVLKELEFA